MKSLIIALAGGSARADLDAVPWRNIDGSDGEQIHRGGAETRRQQGDRATITNHPTIVDTKNDKGDTGLIIAIRDVRSRLDRLPAEQGRRPQRARRGRRHPADRRRQVRLRGSSRGGSSAWTPRWTSTNKSGETALIIAVQQRDARLVKAAARAWRRSRPRRTPSPAIRRATMPTATLASRDIQKLINDKKPKGGSPPLISFAERRVDLRSKPPRGAAREAQQLGLAPRGSQRPVRPPGGSTAAS